MPNNDHLSQIQQVVKDIIPADGHLYLYGSRARGNFRPDSDWDGYKSTENQSFDKIYATFFCQFTLLYASFSEVSCLWFGTCPETG